MNCPSRRIFLSLAAAGVLASVSVMAQTVKPDRAAEPLPTANGSDIARSRCLECHGSELIVQQRLSREGWLREVDKMIAWGARVDDADKRTLVEYLAEHFPDRPRRAAFSLAAKTGAQVLDTRCTACHGVDLIRQQRLGTEGWSREVDKMVGWGTTLTSEERSALVEYLSTTYGVLR